MFFVRKNFDLILDIDCGRLPEYYYSIHLAQSDGQREDENLTPFDVVKQERKKGVLNLRGGLKGGI